MARIIYGPIITDIKGSIGGITFQKNGAGTIARLKPRKNQTNTQKQRDQQPRLKQIQREWNLLSLVNKILWNDFGAVNNKIGLDGQEKKLTGYQWFLSINENLLLINEDILEAPPIYEIVNPLTGFIFSWNQFSLRGFLQGIFDNSLYTPLVYSSFVVNSLSKFDFNICRLVDNNYFEPNTVRFDFYVGTLIGWEAYFNSVFPPNLGNKAFYLATYVRMVSKSSGISSLAYTTISKFVWDGAKYVIE